MLEPQPQYYDSYDIRANSHAHTGDLKLLLVLESETVLLKMVLSTHFFFGKLQVLKTAFLSGYHTHTYTPPPTHSHAHTLTHSHTHTFMHQQSRRQ